LQRFSYVPGTNSTEPAGIIGVAFDINHYKTDSSIVHTIEKVTSTEHGLINELVFKKVHPIYEDEKQQRLSKREIEILKCMAEGLSSKQIADKLGLSINTINNHRRNMLHKMQFKSSAEVINHAVKHGLI
jgi:DNA-binding CsgD family transcriptional regulator